MNDTETASSVSTPQHVSRGAGAGISTCSSTITTTTQPILIPSTKWGDPQPWSLSVKGPDIFLGDDLPAPRYLLLASLPCPLGRIFDSPRLYADHNCVKEPVAVLRLLIDEGTRTTRHNSKLLGRNGNNPGKEMDKAQGIRVGVALYSSATGNKKTFWPPGFLCQAGERYPPLYGYPHIDRWLARVRGCVTQRSHVRR
jgi:hypothetical protein